MSATNSVSFAPPPDPASLLRRERENASIDPLAMHRFIEGSAEKSNQILRLYSSLEKDPVMAASYRDYELDLEEQRELTTLRINRMTRYIETDSASDFARRLNLVTIYDPSMGIRISVNLGLFLNCIRGNGTSDQYEYWAKHHESAIMKQMYGCFAMTELGHGSNVAGCETTAIFDKANDEFVINTPHIGATKWWIGGAAHSATHSVVYARLVVDGKDYGVKTFVVPLRDSNHDLLPGVSVGDIGAKMGREGVDNGWIQYSNVRIPRFFMLQKWCRVSPEGKVTLPPLEQLSYISLLGGRVMMAVDSYRMSARFVTVALRYAVGRRQFASATGRDGEETQLLDYPLHQKRLLPYLALAYAMAVGSNKLELQHGQIVAKLEDAVANNDKQGIDQSIALTKSLFVDSGSLKSTYTWLTADCINEARQLCGGLGYSSYNGFGKLYGDWVVQCTWEGDNNVLGMSAGKTIINNLKLAVQKNKLISGSLSYLSRGRQGMSDKYVLGQDSDVENPEKVLEALETLIIRVAGAALNTLSDNGNDWDSISHTRVLLSKLQCHRYTLFTFIERLGANEDSQLKDSLVLLLKLYYYVNILQAFAGEFLTFNVMLGQVQASVSLRAIPATLKALRPYAITLSDSFQQPDMILNSAIGRYNGDIYENYFGVVKAANPPIRDKAPYSAAFQAMLNRPDLQTRERFEKWGAARMKLSRDE